MGSETHCSNRNPQAPILSAGSAPNNEADQDIIDEPHFWPLNQLTRRDAAKLLGISERSLGRHRETLQALGLAEVRNERTVYHRDGLVEGYLSIVGQQMGNAETVERLHRMAEAESSTRKQLPPDDLEDIPHPGEKVPPWADSRARREFYLAEKEGLALRRLEGSLVDREAMKRMIFEETRRARDAFQRMAVLLPPELKRCQGDLGAMGIVLQEAIHRTLVELSAGHKAGIDDQVRKQQQEAGK